MSKHCRLLKASADRRNSDATCARAMITSVCSSRHSLELCTQLGRRVVPARQIPPGWLTTHRCGFPLPGVEGCSSPAPSARGWTIPDSVPVWLGLAACMCARMCSVDADPCPGHWARRKVHTPTPARYQFASAAILASCSQPRSLCSCSRKSDSVTSHPSRNRYPPPLVRSRCRKSTQVWNANRLPV